MTIFELVKIALDELYKDAAKEYGAETDQKIIDQLDYLSQSYKGLSDPKRPPIDYGDPAVRFAYVFRYVAAHGDYIVQVLKYFRAEHGAVLPGPTARVSCIGGGPGSDVIAILKYLSDMGKHEKVEKLICYLLDGEQGWADAWTEFDESLESDVNLSPIFQKLDVSNFDSWQSQKKFLQADLFTMSYFVSEVMSQDGGGDVSAFWLKLFEEAKPGALFLYIDNGADLFNEYIDTLASKGGLKTLMSKNNRRFTPSFTEQASELSAYRKKFGQNPKLQAQLSFRVFEKA
ncbi:hypothetical protein [Phenylobacterium sp.]|uniref:hypothetical protein n=1 Tax=Phenylobacterium sp. TaxID=1871053 RepID=UPI002810A1D6|nr:hypothetical protein [Phenylobacterium sp.]